MTADGATSRRTTQRNSNGGAGNRPTPAALARRVCEELGELVGREPEGVVSLERTEDGWSVGVEVLELHRVPDTADVLAEYEVSADSRGRLTGYRRVARYARGRTRAD